jgi:hypothetical protein
LTSLLSNRIPLTTDSHRVYLDAVERAFGSEIDYAMLVKMYGDDPCETEMPYSSMQGIGAIATAIIGKPDYRTFRQATWSDKSCHADSQAAFYAADQGFFKKVNRDLYLA